MRRVGEFLSLPEPPEPWHLRSGSSSSDSGGTDAGLSSKPANGHAAPAAANGHAAASAAAADGEPPAVAVRGADFDWADRSWAAPAGGAPAAAHSKAAHGAVPAAPEASSKGGADAVAAVTAAAVAAAPSPAGFQLRDLCLAVPKGQLVGIAGAVGAGKSSVLAALLGELQPSAAALSGGGAAAPAAAAEAPVSVRGRVAYCSQVPWIVSGSVKVREKGV